MSDVPKIIPAEEQAKLRKAVGKQAMAGNTAAVKHGGRSPRYGIVFAKLGKRFAPAYHDVCRMRKHLERLVIERLGSVQLMERCKIQTICRLEMSVRSCEMTIRDNPEMAPEEISRQRALICQWSCQRDNAISELLGEQRPTSGPDWAGVMSGRYDRPTASQP